MKLFNFLAREGGGASKAPPGLIRVKALIARKSYPFPRYINLNVSPRLSLYISCIKVTGLLKLGNFVVCIFPWMITKKRKKLSTCACNQGNEFRIMSSRSNYWLMKLILNFSRESTILKRLKDKKASWCLKCAKNKLA